MQINLLMKKLYEMAEYAPFFFSLRYPPVLIIIISAYTLLVWHSKPRDRHESRYLHMAKSETCHGGQLSTTSSQGNASRSRSIRGLCSRATCATQNSRRGGGDNRSLHWGRGRVVESHTNLSLSLLLSITLYDTHSLVPGSIDFFKTSSLPMTQCYRSMLVNLPVRCRCQHRHRYASSRWSET